MTVQAAYNIAIKTFLVSVGESGAYFTALGWKSPESGEVTGPFLVHIHGNTAIEINEKGEYRDSYPAKADHYFPWFAPGLESGRGHSG